MSRSKLIKSTGTIGFATAISRVLGFVRDILIASKFGTGIYADAFWVAFRLPNTLRDMIGEGATNAAIVPVLTEYSHLKSREEYWVAARVILNLMLVVLVGLSALGVVFAPLLVKAIAPGFLEDPEKFSVTVTLTRMVFPYILLIGMVAYAKGVLNSLQYFFTPAFAPVALNVTMISALVFLCPVIGIKGVAAGVVLGGIIQVFLQIPPLYARGFRFGKGFHLAHPVAKRVGRLLLPRAVGTGVYQLSIFIDTILASLAWIVGSGGVSALQYANRLVQLPLAVFGISLVTAVLPRMTKEAVLKDTESLKDTVLFSLTSVFTVMIPASVGLMVLARPIISLLFERGQFAAYSTAITSGALFFYSFGLAAYAGIKILVSVYYAMGDTRTPVKTAVLSLVINIALNFALMWPLKVGGLALATSIAAFSNFIALYVILEKRLGDMRTRRMLGSLTRISAAAAVMAGFAFVSARVFLSESGLSVLAMTLRFSGVFVTSILIYIVAAHISGVEGVRRMRELIYEFVSKNKRTA